MSFDLESSENLKSEDFILTPDFTPEDYTNIWSDGILQLSNDSEEVNIVLQKFYKYVWDLLFEPDATEANQARAIALLQAQRQDAAFFNPFDYNKWIRQVKSEIIKRDMVDLWEKGFREKELGLLWALESDYFDNYEDPEPALFYKLKDSDPPYVFS